MSELLLVVAAVGAAVIYKAVKAAKYPHRLLELQTALQNHADLSLHRNKDASSASELVRLVEHLKYAQLLVTASNESVHQEWASIRPSLLHLISEDVLTRIDLFYTDRREDIKAAVYRLVSQLDKKAGAGSNKQ